MRIITWNVNGIRAAQKKGFLTWLDQSGADVVALQEIKAKPEQLDDELLAGAGYSVAWNPAERPGYSGTATFAKKRLTETRIARGFGEKRFDLEGRTLVTKHAGFSLYNVYFPNGKKDDVRLKYKMDFYDALFTEVQGRCAAGEKIVVCGDWNTAHKEIDLARPKPNRKFSGFLPEECAKMDEWIDAGWVDSFRVLHPDLRDAYSWWSMRAGARQKNIGWRLDTFFVSPNLAGKISASEIHADVLGSDHCPVSLDLRT
ncbi:MAG: exodeoxyribonuclease III [Planctomycetota bacterium]